MKKDSRNLQARMAQLEVAIGLSDEGERACLTEMLKRENELLNCINRIQKDLGDVQRQKALVIQEGAERHAKLLDEYRALEAILQQRGETKSWDAVRESFSDIKALMSDSKLSEYAAEVIQAERSCWTSCVQCVTNACVQCVTDCTQCVTSACVQCVINGSGNLCGISSLVSSPCRPKPDIGEQLTTRDFEKLEVAWRDDVKQSAQRKK